MSTEREVLEAVYARMAEKVPMLQRMAEDPGSTLVERYRLNGKAQGVALAASYVDEAIRELGPPA